MQQNYSYWEYASFFDYDIIIVGSGIVGLSAAISLKEEKPKLKICILEAGVLPSGASTKNAGFACFGSVSELIEQENKIGSEKLYNLISKRWNGLKKLRNRLGDQNIGFENDGGYELFAHQDTAVAEQCDAKLSYFNAMVEDITGLKETFKWSNHKIQNFGFSNTAFLMENKCESSVHTGKMMKQLILLAQEKGVHIVNSCDVKGIESHASSQVIFTSVGNFKAKKTLLCTNAFSKRFFPELDLQPGRGQVIVTNEIPDLKVKGTFHYNQGFYYFRNIDNRILLGGGRNLDFETEQTTSFGNTAVVLNALKRLLSDVILPGHTFDISYQWSGIMAFGSELSPIVEEIKPNIFCAVRCNGMGIAIGSQVGEDLALMTKKAF